MVLGKSTIMIRMEKRDGIDLLDIVFVLFIPDTGSY
jgi:hypothetical protein